MKTVIRIPTIQYGYLEFEFEGSPEDAIQEHNRIAKLYNGGTGLTDVLMDKIVEEMMLGIRVKNGTEMYAEATPTQQAEIQRIKRALKRIAARQNK